MIKRRSKAIFIDRDGTIIRDTHHLANSKDLKLLPGVAKAIRKFNRLGYAVIIITNQAAIAKNLLTEENLKIIHDTLTKRLLKKGARIDSIYYCPHHPEGKIKKYRICCSCRKPKVGMLKKAIRDFGINTKKSFMIGDKTGDILAGKRASLKTILIKTGYGGKDNHYSTKPDFTAKNLLEAVTIVTCNKIK